VTQVKRPDKDGYEMVQLGYEIVRRLNRPRKGHLASTGKLFRYLREVEVADISGVEVGQEINVSVFHPGERVDATGLSKGRGFAGGVKRHGFAGGPKTHGQSDRHRAPGSIGAGTSPGRVVKGHKMAGHMGNSRVTVRNLEVVSVDPDRDLLLVKGAVPGARNSLIIIRKTVWE
jgi:large subunit ribosomal protein L3